MFEAYGEVSSAKVITDRETGRSRGFGFVEMDNDGEAQQAIDALNGRQIEGKAVVVQQARPREEMRKQSGGGGSYSKPSYNKSSGGGSYKGGGGYGSGNTYKQFNDDDNDF